MPTLITSGVNNNNQRGINFADPTAGNDAATKQYVDLYINGITLKAPVRAATTANITLSGTQTIDGVALVAGDRVLVKDQSTATANGIYVVNSSAWSRATDADVNAEVVAGMTVFINEGTNNADKQMSLVTNNPITLGTTNLVFGNTAVSGQVYTAGNGININSGVVTAVAKSGGSLAVDAGGIYIDPTGPLAARRYAINASSSSATTTVTHNLNTLNVLVQVNLVSTGEVVIADETIVNANTVTVTFPTTPSAGQYNIVVVG